MCKHFYANKTIIKLRISSSSYHILDNILQITQFFRMNKNNEIQLFMNLDKHNNWCYWLFHCDIFSKHLRKIENILCFEIIINRYYLHWLSRRFGISCPSLVSEETMMKLKVCRERKTLMLKPTPMKCFSDIHRVFIKLD